MSVSPMRFKADFLSCFNLFAQSPSASRPIANRLASLPTPLASFVLIGLSASFLAGCDEVMNPSSSFTNARAQAPIPYKTQVLMAEHGTTRSAPILIRTYKKEAELEIWKMGIDGRYAHLKTYPMCRWSGQLGPKVREGDRQVPEGFYTITPAQMHPNSHYYLSFDVGYPNTYDRALGHTGGSIMVHGVCSSAGCFSMTDEQIEEIYAIVREAFAGGQRGIQMQSYPFHMTAENLARYRLDPNIAFWRQLKEGADHFDITRQEVVVGVCDRHYVFNALPTAGGFDPTGPCPPLRRNPEETAVVAARANRDEAKIAEFASHGVKPVHTVYADGGQHPSFAARAGEVSRPEALAQAPIDYDLEEGKPNPKDKKGKAQPAMTPKLAESTPAAGAAMPPPMSQTAAPAQPTTAVAAMAPSAVQGSAQQAGSQASVAPQAGTQTAGTSTTGQAQQSEAGGSFFNVGRLFNWKSEEKPAETTGSIQPAPQATAQPVTVPVAAKTAAPVLPSHPTSAAVPRHQPLHAPASTTINIPAAAAKGKAEEKTVKATQPAAQPNPQTAEQQGVATVANIASH